MNPYDYLMELWELLDDEQKERLLEIAETLATPITLSEDDKPSD